MASKRPNPKAPPPASSSSSEEEEEELEPVVAAKKSIPKPKPSQPLPSPSDDDDEEEEGDGSSSSEEEEEEDPVRREQTPKKAPLQPPSESPEKSMAVANIKPINSKPMDSPNQKRRKAPAEPPSGEERPGKKPKLFQRFWSEGDEIKILRGILAFHSERGTDPSSPSDMDALHDFMKRFIGSEFSKSQLSSKIRRLKKKHDAIAARGKAGPKPQDLALYEIAAKVWGSKKIDASIDKPHQKKKKEKKKLPKIPLAIDYEFLGKAVAKFGDGEISRSVLDKGLKLMDAGKAMALEKQFRELEYAKMKNHLQWLDAMEMATQLIVDTMGRSA